MPRKEPGKRKRRTREHVIADLSVNYVERQALLCNYSMERFIHDYGLDLLISTYSDSGDYENGEVRIQVKATDHLRLIADGRFATWRVSREDVHHWLHETMPVILVLYDAAGDVAYWLYVQAFFQGQRDFDIAKLGKQVTIPIPTRQVLDRVAMRKFAEYRDRVQAQARGVVHHE